jgi:hypothetical protein
MDNQPNRELNRIENDISIKNFKLFGSIPVQQDAGAKIARFRRLKQEQQNE